MRIMYNNLADDGTITSNSAAADNYPLINLQDQRLSKTYRTSNQSTTAIITIDLGSDLSPNVLAIIGHNLSSSAVIRFSGTESMYATWNSGIILSFFNSLAYTSKLITESDDNILTETGNYLITENMPAKLMTESQEIYGDYLLTEDNNYLTTENMPDTVRYCYIEIYDPLNIDGYLDIGRIWVGTYMTINPSSLLDFKVTKKRNDTVIYGKGRGKFSLEGITWREIELNFPKTEYTMVDQIRNMVREIGFVNSIIFCNFDTIRDYPIVEPLYCSIVDNTQFIHSERMKFSYALKLEEDL